MIKSIYLFCSFTPARRLDGGEGRFPLVHVFLVKLLMYLYIHSSHTFLNKEKKQTGRIRWMGDEQQSF